MAFFYKKQKTNKMKNYDEQIKVWKEQYGTIYALPIEDKTAFLREPKMKDFKRAFTVMQNDGDLAFGEQMINLLFIGGDEEIKTNDEYFFPARKEIKEFFNFEEAEFTKEKNNTIITIGEARCKVRIITRDDLKIAEKENPSGKPFVTQEKLFDRVCIEKDEAFKDRDNASLRFPLYQAIEKLQNQKIAIIKKL
jgi:hypothetical protein